MNFDNIKSSWEKYESLCKRFEDENIDKMLDTLGERLLMCPASRNKDHYGAYPGGLIEHALHVSSYMKNLVDTYSLDISTMSILKVGLLHDIGKVGDLENNYFLEQDSDWHKEKLGQNYKYNENLSRMSISHQTLWLLQHFGISLTRDEWLAIQIAQGPHFDENKFYAGHEPSISIILQQAKAIVIHKKKNQ